MIVLEEALTKEKIAQIVKDLERLKKLSKTDGRSNEIKALERLLEANKIFCEKMN
jgi:hypothetical protein